MVAFVVISRSPAQPADKIRLTFWHSISLYMGNTIDQLIRDFNVSNARNVEVQGIFQGTYDNAVAKLISAAGSGHLPDMAQISVEQLDLFMEDGLIHPVDGLISEEDRKDILQPFWNVVSRKGKIWAMPFNHNVQLLFYNKDFFSQTGLDPQVPPTTWDEVLIMSQRLTKDTNGDGTSDRWGILIGIVNLYSFTPFIVQMGGIPFTPDMKKATFNDGAGVRALTFLQDLVYKHRVMPPKMTIEEALGSFLTGNIAMGASTSAIIKFTEENLPWPLGVAFLPRGVRSFSALSGAGLVVFEKDNPERQRAAWEFVGWLGNKKNTIKWHVSTGYLPLRKSALDSLELKVFHRKNPNFRVAVEQLSTAYPIPSTRNLEKLNKIIRDMVEAIMLYQADPKTELDKAATLANRALAN
jgi:ABC-type glycerol-3-phosphate transport system substrate-binding protein